MAWSFVRKDTHIKEPRQSFHNLMNCLSKFDARSFTSFFEQLDNLWQIPLVAFIFDSSVLPKQCLSQTGLPPYLMNGENHFGCIGWCFNCAPSVIWCVSWVKLNNFAWNFLPMMSSSVAWGPFHVGHISFWISAALWRAFEFDVPKHKDNTFSKMWIFRWKLA